MQRKSRVRLDHSITAGIATIRTGGCRGTIDVGTGAGWSARRTVPGTMDNRVAHPFLGRVGQHVIGINKNDHLQRSDDHDHHEKNGQSELNRGLSLLAPMMSVVCHYASHPQFIARIETCRWKTHVTLPPAAEHVEIGSNARP